MQEESEMKEQREIHEEDKKKKRGRCRRKER
jgi:hypothetical protein